MTPSLWDGSCFPPCLTIRLPESKSRQWMQRSQLATITHDSWCRWQLMGLAGSSEAYANNTFENLSRGSNHQQNLVRGLEHDEYIYIYMNMCLFFFRRSFSEVYMIRSSCRRESCGPPMSNPWLEDIVQDIFFGTAIDAGITAAWCETLPISFCNAILFQVSGRILIKWQFASISITNFMAFGNSCSTKTALILLVWSTFTTNYDWISSTVV